MVGVRLGKVAGVDGDVIDVKITMEAAPAVLVAALVVPDGRAAIDALSQEGQALEFVKDQ
jgi:catalase